MAVLTLGGGVLGFALGNPTVLSAQQHQSSVAPAVTPALVLDEVTVIDVRQGHHIPGQRVVIVGNHITTVGSVGMVKIPTGARVVDAHGKFLIPGLWDMHTHSGRNTDLSYPLLIATGVTGIRDAGSPVPLDTLRLWRQEILANIRVGPPRQILSGPQINDSIGQVSSLGLLATMFGGKPDLSCQKGTISICVHSLADARHVVDSLQAAGADMIKTYSLGRETYFTIATEARRVGIPFGGHIGRNKEPSFVNDPREGVSVTEASDSGASIIDHRSTSGGLDTLCLGSAASVERCQPVVERFRRNGTWWVPTIVMQTEGIGSARPGRQYLIDVARLDQFDSTFWGGTTFQRDWLRDSAHVTPSASVPRLDSSTDVGDYLRIAHRVGLPIVAGTDQSGNHSLPPGFSLHVELAMYVAEGLTPLEALQTATLNPAKLLHGTDSLGTVASGKLADLVLLDADPLVDITNTTAIAAVVANGRYFDRAALDQLVVTARATPVR